MELAKALEILRATPGSYRWEAIRAAQAAVLAELDRRGAAIERVRELCADLMVEDVKGGLTNADSLWPTDVLAALDGAGG